MAGAQHKTAAEVVEGLTGGLQDENAEGFQAAL
jgi:hypothetical protein